MTAVGMMTRWMMMMMMILILMMMLIFPMNDWLRLKKYRESQWMQKQN